MSGLKLWSWGRCSRFGWWRGVTVFDEGEGSMEEELDLKVDFEKAYDSVDWVFLEYMMRRVGLCDKWVRWMKALCVWGKYVDPS